MHPAVAHEDFQRKNFGERRVLSAKFAVILRDPSESSQNAPRARAFDGRANSQWFSFGVCDLFATEPAEVSLEMFRRFCVISHTSLAHQVDDDVRDLRGIGGKLQHVHLRRNT